MEKEMGKREGKSERVSERMEVSQSVSQSALRCIASLAAYLPYLPYGTVRIGIGKILKVWVSMCSRYMYRYVFIGFRFLLRRGV